MKTANHKLFAKVTETLDDYGRELVDVLDHVTDGDEIRSYGAKSEALEDLQHQWSRFVKSLEKQPRVISIVDRSGNKLSDERLVLACLAEFGISSATLHRNLEDPSGIYRVLLSEKEADDLTEEEVWPRGVPCCVEIDDAVQVPGHSARTHCCKEANH